MRRSFNFVFFLSFPMMFGLISVSKQFVPIFFGQGYDKVALLINIISPILVLMGVANVIGTQYLLPTKRQKKYTISITVGLIINFILNSIFIRLWDSVGASIATVISQLVVDIMQIYMIRKLVNIRKMFKGGRNYFLAAFLMFVVCYLVGLLFKQGLVSIIVKVVVGGIIYIGILLLIKDENIYMIIDKIKSRFKKRLEYRTWRLDFLI